MDIRQFRHQLRRLERRLDNALQTGTDCCGVTLVQCHTLLEIRDNGSLNLNDLAERMELDKSTVSRTVDTLVQDELVDRNPNPANRRAVILGLTPAGNERADRIHQVCDGYFMDILKHIPESEAETVLKGLTILADALEVSIGNGTCCALPAGEVAQ